MHRKITKSIKTKHPHATLGGVLAVCIILWFGIEYSDFVAKI